MAETRLSLRALNRATLARQMLLRREKVKVVAAVERLAGMQAQVPRPPFVGLWSRLAGFARADLVRAIESRDVVRATMMRGTLHLVSRADFLAWRPALQPMLTRGAFAILRDRAADVDVPPLVSAAREFFSKEPRTFAELRDHLGSRFPGVNERVMGYVVRTHLPLIQTPIDNAPWAYPAVADFAVAEAWLGEPMPVDDSAHALALKYFAAFGPATAADFQSWSALNTGRAIVDELRPKLHVVRDERGRELFDLPKAPRPDEGEEAPVRFLPEFDNLVLAYADRTRLVDPAHKPALATKNLFVPATFLVDGFIAGIWTVERTKRLARLVLKPFAALSKPVKAELEAEGDALLQFMEPDAPARAVDVAGGKPAKVAAPAKAAEPTKVARPGKAVKPGKVAKSIKAARKAAVRKAAVKKGKKTASA